MPDFDVEAFVTGLDRLGMKLTAVPLADGKVRINRWRMLNACEHAQEIHDIWATHIGNDQRRIDALAAHLDRAASQTAGYSFSPNRIWIGSQSAATPDAVTGDGSAPDSRKTAAPQFAATSQRSCEE
ncbi:MAG TPA: hypothetical protein VKP67_25725 [Xanthobacteraceae bacterium]|nr:hypothetical protein [Xanthobacteraceae bacterium]